MASCVVLYHYYYPDDVVSARLFTDFAEDLTRQGWDVQVFSSDKYCKKKDRISKKFETRHGVSVRRFRHPPFPESKNIGRLLNSFLLSVNWFFALLFLRVDVAIFGTDPQFLYFIIPILKVFRPKMKVALWGFDLYPEVIIADGIKLPVVLRKILAWWAGVSYRHCGLLVDIGSCMRERLVKYSSKAKHETIVPWALDEPRNLVWETNDSVRQDLFGNAELGLLYSGTIGKAHQFEEFILLARELRRRDAPVSFCFAGRGNYCRQLREMTTKEDSNIAFGEFIDEKYLPLRLAAADLHLISLRQGWEGIVVPSKFFGSLAAGRPLLYCGAGESCVAKWIRDEDVGFVVTKDTIGGIADALELLCKNKLRLRQMQERSFSFYQRCFTKEIQRAKWNKSLREYIAQ
jgi:glycosyltransferase involved in cell wall biosynthesis